MKRECQNDHAPKIATVSHTSSIPQHDSGKNSGLRITAPGLELRELHLEVWTRVECLGLRP